MSSTLTRIKTRNSNKANRSFCFFCGGERAKDMGQVGGCRCKDKDNRISPAEAAMEEAGTVNVADLEVGDILCVRDAKGWHEGWRVTEVTSDETHVCCEQTMSVMGQGRVTKTKTFANTVSTYIYRPTRDEGEWRWWFDV